jgi:hypothetical protein
MAAVKEAAKLLEQLKVAATSRQAAPSPIASG